MNAKETKRRGIEYCKKHAHTCIKCPLLYNICIDWSGRFIKSSPTDDYPDFDITSPRFWASMVTSNWLYGLSTEMLTPSCSVLHPM